MLTEKRIRDAKPESKPKIMFDRTLAGFGVKISPGGAKAFVLRYRLDGRSREVRIARVGEMSLKAARERAAGELAAIREGSAGTLERRRERRDAPTVSEGVDRFFRDYAPRRIADGRMKESTAETYRKQWTRTLKDAPAFGNLKVADVTRADVERALAKRAPIQRNRVLAFLSRLFTYFESIEYRPQHSNPCRHVEKAREEARDRVLTPSELSALSAALEEEEQNSPVAVAAIRFAALTGLRIGEVLSMRWEHVDFETGRLLLPDTKTGRRWHDLPSAALAVLASHFRINEYVFTNGTGPAGYKRVRIHFATAAKRAGLDDVRLHDLRRTVMTQAAMAGIGTHVLRDLLGHKTTAMADRYIRNVGNPVREAREAVGAQMAAMMDGKTGKVVQLR